MLDDFRRLETYSDGTRRSNSARGGQNKGQLQAWKSFLNAIRSGKPPIPYDQIYAVSLATFRAMDALRSNERKSIESYEPEPAPDERQ